MNTAGTYEEKLPCGGSLKITKTSWQIAYYFSGPDMRYNGTFVHVHGGSIEQYIQAFIDNWEEYEKLRSIIPKGGDFSMDGKMGMTIRIAGFANGVCIQSYHLPISSKQRLDQIVEGYRYAQQRAPQIQAFLKSL
jgi:hypothetical protein